MNVAGSLAAEPGMKQQTYIAYAIQENAHLEGAGGPDGVGVQANVGYTMEARHRPQNVGGAMGVRRITPTEAERLQGFPDSYTAIQYRGKPAADGPRYRALGNSKAVPVVRWIGERIAQVDSIMRKA